MRAARQRGWSSPRETPQSFDVIEMPDAQEWRSALAAQWGAIQISLTEWELRARLQFEANRRVIRARCSSDIERIAKLRGTQKPFLVFGRRVGLRNS